MDELEQAREKAYARRRLLETGFIGTNAALGMAPCFIHELCPSGLIPFIELPPHGYARPK